MIAFVLRRAAPLVFVTTLFAAIPASAQDKPRAALEVVDERGEDQSTLYRDALLSSLREMGFSIVEGRRTVAAMAQVDRLGGLEDVERGKTLLTLLNAHRVVRVRLVSDDEGEEYASVVVVEREALHRERIPVENASAISGITTYLRELPLFQEPRLVQVEPPRSYEHRRKPRRTPEQIKEEAWAERGGVRFSTSAGFEFIYIPGADNISDYPNHGYGVGLGAGLTWLKLPDREVAGSPMVAARMGLEVSPALVSHDFSYKPYVFSNVALRLGGRFGTGRFVRPFQWRGWVFTLDYSPTVFVGEFHYADFHFLGAELGVERARIGVDDTGAVQNTHIRLDVKVVGNFEEYPYYGNFGVVTGLGLSWY